MDVNLDGRSDTMTYAETPQYDPIKAAWNTVASYSSYDEAQAAVDRLSDDGFPIENLDIIGSDLRLLERVTGRMTRARAAGKGAVTGAGLGAFIGLLFGLFTPGFTWLGVVLAGTFFGAGWGVAFGFASQAFGPGGRGFASTRRLVAASYAVVVRGGYTEQARNLLERADRSADAPGPAPMSS